LTVMPILTERHSLSLQTSSCGLLPFS
jgi:hypothetical protein